MPVFCFAQNPFEQNTFQQSQVDKIDFDDTTKVWQPFKVFEVSYHIAQQENNIFHVDTGLQLMQIYDPAQTADFIFRNGGNVGQASQAIYFQHAAPFGFDLGYHAFDLYRLNRKKIRQYQTTYPFTEFNFNIGKNREQIAQVYHSQNIKNRFKFDFEYHRTAGRGLFRNQQSTHNNFAIQFELSSKNQRYTFNQLFILSIVDAQENGGLAQSGVLFDKNNDLSSEILSVNLQRARTKFNDKDVRIRQTYALGKMATQKINDSTSIILRSSPVMLYHEAGWERSLMRFSDFAPDTNFYGAFYLPDEDTLNGPDTLLNLVRYNSFYQNMGIQFQWLKSHEGDAPKYKNVWIDAHAEYQFFDTRYGDNEQNFQQLNLHAKATHHAQSVSKWKYEAAASLSLINYNSGDFLLSGFIGYQTDKAGFFKIHAKQQHYEPALVHQKFSINDFSWNNQFKKINFFNTGVQYVLQRYQIQVETNYFLYHDYIFSNEQKLPEQVSSAVSIFQVGISKNFTWKFLGLENQIRWQNTNRKNIIPLPKLWTRNSFFIEKKLFKSALQSRIGVDMFFNKDYFAQGYFPLTGQFYSQSILKQQFYPVFDIWASFKIKTFRIFFKVEHVNQDLFSPPNFYNFLDLPGTQRAFRMGLSWRFYD